MSTKIPRREWRWFGHAGHFICARWCQFHLTTEVGDYIVSTVGEYVPPESVREILASSRGITLTGHGRKYETMVFRCGATPCDIEDCGCGMRVPDSYSELDFRVYNLAGDAARGHLELCEKWADPETWKTVTEEDDDG